MGTQTKNNENGCLGCFAVIFFLCLAILCVAFTLGLSMRLFSWAAGG